MNQELRQILRLNHIQDDVLDRAIHQDIREMFLDQICKYMKSSPERYVEIRRFYYRSSDDIQTVKQILQRVCGGSLPEEDLAWLNRCIKAHLHKAPRRRPIPGPERLRLWRAQDGRCAVCRRPLDPGRLHVDHIVPWDYVGDELSDNLRVLCPDCNKTKGSRLSQALRNLFFTKGDMPS